MKNLIIRTSGKLMLLGLLAGLASCSGLFRDPMIDKDTGGKLTVLLMDRNFIRTTIVVRLEDYATGVSLEGEAAEVRFSGGGASGLITFAGNKTTTFNTSSGFVEAGYDPNVPLDATHPLAVTVFAISEHYISAPQFVSFTQEGIKNLVIRLIRKADLKSAATGAFSEPFDLVYNGSKESTELSFISDISGLPTGTDWSYLNLYETKAAGTMVCNNLRDAVFYNDYGAYLVLLSGGGLMPPSAATKGAVLRAGDFIYTAILKSGIEKCGSGITIHVDRPDGLPGTGVFDYVISFSNGDVQSGSVTCTFPSDNLIEQVYYPVSDPDATVALSGDLQYDMSDPVYLLNSCGGTASFSASPKSSLKAYKFITRYTCPDSPVGMGLSVAGEFRRTGSADAWTSFEFTEGICQLLLEPNADYDFRVNIDGEYYNYMLPTDITRVESYLREHQGEDYTLNTLTIESTESLVTISADVQFSQGICDKLR
jgi:hypothetical protein